MKPFMTIVIPQAPNELLVFIVVTVAAILTMFLHSPHEMLRWAAKLIARARAIEAMRETYKRELERQLIVLGVKKEEPAREIGRAQPVSTMGFTQPVFIRISPWRRFRMRINSLFSGVTHD